MGQAELDNKLSAIVPNTAFKLDERSTLDILNWLKKYAAIIPFDQDKKQFWDSFYFIQANNPQQLACIYQQVNQANGLLPPHQAFILAFLKLLETTKRLLNTFPARHRDLYYRELLGLNPKNAQADSVAISVSLNTDNAEFLVAQGTLFDAGQDSAGNSLQYASVRIELTEQDFMHTQYWKDPTGKNLPYTPQISALQIIFSAKVKTEQYTVYPLTPFGWGNPNAELPSFANDTLYLGFTNVLPGQTLSLYWQLVGTQELTLSWSYLNQQNIWQPLNQLVHDQTHNLFDRGIWSTLLPQDASNQAALMPAGRYWLKTEITQQTAPQDYPRMQGILYNATTATLINPAGIENDHFINGLVADSIKQTVSTSAAISRVTQPWASWNGRPKETEPAFLTRIPPRLSHRNRALSWNNIVTLLKENFTSIFDVKYPSANELTKIPAPETQQLIVIPDSRYKDNDDALRPILNPARLAEMVHWISQLSSPWTTLKIDNPTYVDVLISYQRCLSQGLILTMAVISYSRNSAENICRGQKIIAAPYWICTVAITITTTMQIIFSLTMYS